MEIRKINVDNSHSVENTIVQAPKEIVLNRPNNPGNMPKLSEGNNILNNITDIDKIINNLKDMDIMVLARFYSVFHTGRICILLYCITTNGQYMFVELPPNTQVTYGDVQINIQRPDVLQSNIREIFKENLKSIMTGYAFICQGGIHYIRSHGEQPLIYGYDDPREMENFKLRKFSFIVVPAVNYIKLRSTIRFNTLETALDVIDETKTIRKIFNKAGLISFLTIKGPLTVFLPDTKILKTIENNSEEEIKSILLAHIVIGRIDVINLNDPVINGVSLNNNNNGQETYKAIAQNDIILNKSNGKVEFISITGSNKKIRVLKTIRKFNGIIHIVDSIFTPIQTKFTLPESSDLDDVITIFDVNKATMEIRRAQYDINQENQKQSLILSQYTLEKTQHLFDVILELSKTKGDKLLKDTTEYMNLFYTRQVPCVDECIRMDDLSEDLTQQNIEYENLIRQSNYLGSLRVAFEEMLLKLSTIEQSLRHTPEE